MNVYLGTLYKEVEYIQSSGTQYINTGYAPSNNTKVILSMGGRVSSVERYGTLFGARKGWNPSDWDDSKGFSITYDKYSGYVVMFGRGYNNNISTVPDFGITNGNNHTIQEGGDGIYIDGTLKMSLTSYTFTSPVPMSIFCDNINGENVNFSSYKLYYFKIYNSGTLVRDFIPCYRISDNVIGLFDKVENKFYTNAGTGTFTKGNDVKVFQPELKNAYIGEVPPLVLQKVLDFHNNTRGDFTYVNYQASGLIINTSGGYCTQSEAQTTTGAGGVYKQINAKRFRGRVKFMNVNYKHGNVGIGSYSNQQPTPQGNNQHGMIYVDSGELRIELNGVYIKTGQVSSSLNTYYYLDVKFENGLYTCILLDSNLNKISEITYQSSDLTWNYSGFAMGGGTNNRANWRIYEYREAYDNN